MGVHVQRLEVWLVGVKEDLLPTKTQARAEARAIGADAVELCRERTARGETRNDGVFRPYKSSYRQKKARIVSGRERMPEPPTEWRAGKVNDYGRLSGNLFSAWEAVRPSARIDGQGIEMGVDLRIRNRKMAQRQNYLKKQGRDIFGLSDPGTAAGQRERRYLLSRSRQRLGVSRKRGVRGGVIVT